MTVQYAVGRSDFEKKLHILCCAKVLLDPKSKLSCLNFVSFLGRRAKNIEKKCVKPFLKPATWGNVFFDFFKGYTNEEI